MALFTDHPLYDFLVLATTLFVLVYAYFQQAFTYWKKRNFPYLEPKFPLGNSPRFFSKTLSLGLETTQFYQELRRRHLKYGGVYTMTSPVLVVTDPDYIRDILQKDFHHFVDRGQYHNEKDDPLSATLFALNETKWRNMRMKLTPTFTSGKMKMMFHSVLETSKYMTDAIEQCVQEQKDIDLREYLSCFTTDVIGTCAFGLDCNSFKGTEAEFRRIGKEIFAVRNLRILRLILISKMPTLALKLGVKANNDNVSRFFLDVIKKTVKYREDNNLTRPDFLQLLIDIRNQTKNSENPFTMEQMVSN